ncbi:pX [Turkey adenovirus 1]|uniref:PX n=1 Tax=Turkey adenovirus 1 TaxID=878329 RepID=E0YC66_9ADEN|nr:pX [Turkey adenovirus 1]ADM53799.1 pX [Turkey adenovirus 1]
MPAVVLTGGRVRRSAGKARSRRRKVRVPKAGRRGRASKRSPVLVPSTSTATPAERAALQNLATRLARGQYASWRPAEYTSPAVQEAAKAAASSGSSATARDTSTGTTAQAVPLTGGARGLRRRLAGCASSSKGRRGRRSLKGGFLPALIPIIAAAIGAIPGIAGTAVGIASLQEQKRQFNKMYGNSK